MTNGGIFVGPGEGRTIPGTDVLRLVATGEQTGGSIGVLEDTSSPGDGPPRHVHHSNDELFYVLEGEFLFLVGERQESVSAETCVFVPRGTVHAYKVIGSKRGRLLSAVIPGGPERPSRSSSSCVPREKRWIGARAEAGPWHRGIGCSRR